MEGIGPITNFYSVKQPKYTNTLKITCTPAMYIMKKMLLKYISIQSMNILYIY